jgi:nicotinamidase-related amidase
VSAGFCIDFYRKENLPIVHIVRIYKKDGSNTDLCRRERVENGAEIFSENSIGGELARELFENDNIRNNAELLLSGDIQEITQNEVIIYKPRWGAFYNTPLQKHLAQSDINTIIFTGCNFPNCPRTSIYEASERDYKIVLAEDALSGLYDRGKSELINIGVIVENTRSILDTLSLECA